MYGQIDLEEWGFIPRKYREYDAAKDCRSEWLGDKTVEHLKSVAQENHPILLRIRDREREIERLASNYPAREGDVPEEERKPTMVTLSSLRRETIEEHGHDSQQVQKYQAAINWQENADEIKKLQKEYSVLHYSRPGWWGSEFRWSVYREPTGEEIQSYNLKRQEHFSAESALRWEIQKSITGTGDRWGTWWYEEWDKDYDFRTDFEAFLSNIVSARRNFREELRQESGEEIYNLVQKYLENPLWHLPEITNFLLLDLIDFNLIMLEVTFYFSLFAPNISNEIDAPHSNYYPSIDPSQTFSPCLAPKAKEARRKHRLKHFWIGGGLGFISWVPFVEGSQTISDVWINQGAPSWVFWVTSFIAFFLIVHQCGTIVFEYRLKRLMKYNSICSQANDL